MLYGKRHAAWDHTAALLTVIRRVAGDKHAKFENPIEDEDDVDPRAKFKKFIRGETENGDSH